MVDPLSRPFSIRLPPDQLEHLDELTRLTRRSRNALIAQAVGRYIAEETAFIQAARDATDEALDPDAVLVPHEAVRTWLLSWGTDAEDAAAQGLDGEIRRAELKAPSDQ
jgi:predicted transcriptional regulator